MFKELLDLGVETADAHWFMRYFLQGTAIIFDPTLSKEYQRERDNTEIGRDKAKALIRGGDLDIIRQFSSYGKIGLDYIIHTP
jgi:hypothetical protein